MKAKAIVSPMIVKEVAACIYLVYLDIIRRQVQAAQHIKLQKVAHLNMDLGIIVGECMILLGQVSKLIMKMSQKTKRKMKIDFHFNSITLFSM